MIETLLSALVEQVEDHGQRADTSYKATAWRVAAEKVALVSPPGVVLSIQQCKNRHNSCKADWKVWQELNNLSGFAVNEFGVVVGDSQALIEYFEKHPDARKYRTKPLAYEDLHRRLFDGVIANGAGARDIDQLIAATVEGNSEEDSDEAETLGPRKRRAETLTAAERSRKKMTSADKLSKQVGNMAAEIGGLAEALLKDP
ncbi:hypothetical protein PMIN04_007056 [Paraphaeosphaeria minitans]